MKTLALEFSSEHRGVAVADGDRILGEARETAGRDTHPFALIRAALEQARWRRDEIRRLVVGTGPGSYNGIRTAIAVAQGWHLARGVEVGGIGSLESLAEDLRLQGRRGRLQVTVDAQRGEFYLAAYELRAGGLVIAEALRLVPRQTLAALLAAGEPVFGPPGEADLAGVQPAFPSAVALARLAATRFTPCAPEALEPIYLRDPSFVKAPPPRIIVDHP